MDITQEREDNAENKYIVFLLGEELYGAPILSVREVIEHRLPKRVPNSNSLLEGVINIRGEVIGVIDLRRRFGTKEITPRCQLVFESEGGLLAASVDKVESVVVMDKIETVSQKNIQSLKHAKYLIGIGQLQERLVNIIDLSRVLDTNLG